MNIGIGTFIRDGFTRATVEQAFRRLAAAVSAGWLIQHKEDGTHRAVTADSIAVTGDPGDGSFLGNVGGSLVPTADGQDLGASVTQRNNQLAQLPWRHLYLSGSIFWMPFSSSTLPVTGLPALTRSGNNLTIASDGTFVFSLTFGVNTHTCTIGRGLSGLTTNRSVVCASVSITGAGGLSDHLAITDGITAPSATAGLARIYVDTADGDLKVVFGDGTVKTIVTD